MELARLSSHSSSTKALPSFVSTCSSRFDSIRLVSHTTPRLDRVDSNQSSLNPAEPSRVKPSQAESSRAESSRVKPSQTEPNRVQQSLEGCRPKCGGAQSGSGAGGGACVPIRTTQVPRRVPRRVPCRVPRHHVPGYMSCSGVWTLRLSDLERPVDMAILERLRRLRLLCRTRLELPAAGGGAGATPGPGGGRSSQGQDGWG